eukprot:TRINITY_DN19631_c0_g1_i1.p2 TRINITY_DN19631_c0_g1~~TRINITY_DN19631_c0_g1_i1.p2  ORF type:complete len:294 (-),score=25.52 TRINITY_DN19631_c0_g1_i1:240-1121(-)
MLGHGPLLKATLNGTRWCRPRAKYIDQFDEEQRLRALVVVTNANGSLRAEAVRPVSAEFDIGLGHLGVGEEQPDTEDGLGQHVKNGVGNDFSVDRSLTGTVGNTPDNRVGSPEDEGEGSNGTEKLADLAALGRRETVAVDGEVPDKNKVGDAGNGVPAPLLGGSLSAKGSKETSQDHDQVGTNGNDRVATINTSKEAEVEQQKWCGETPVDVTCPVDFAVDVTVCVGNVAVRLANLDVVVGNTVASGHSVVGDGSNDGDEGGNDMVQTTRHWDGPRQCREDDRGNHHDHKDHP